MIKICIVLQNFSCIKKYVPGFHISDMACNGLRNYNFWNYNKEIIEKTKND